MITVSVGLGRFAFRIGNSLIIALARDEVTLQAVKVGRFHWLKGCGRSWDDWDRVKGEWFESFCY